MSPTTSDQNEQESNGNEGVLYIPQTPRLEPHCGFKYCNLILIILFNIIHFFCTQLNSFKYSK